ncbi:hypothetical protein ACFE04_021546 [Oxalis oulophora]
MPSVPFVSLDLLHVLPHISSNTFTEVEINSQQIFAIIVLFGGQPKPTKPEGRRNMCTRLRLWVVENSTTSSHIFEKRSIFCCNKMNGLGWGPEESQRIKLLNQLDDLM